MPETRVGDHLVFLKDLGKSGADSFLEGGQAVNFWAEYYSAKGARRFLSLQLFNEVRNSPDG